MKILDEVVILKRVVNKTGSTAKGAPYNFYVATIIDDDYNKYECTLPERLKEDGFMPEWIMAMTKEDAEEKSVVADFDVLPDGYGVKMKVINMKLK